MITQTITDIPSAPHKGVEIEDAFVTKQEDFQDAFTAVFLGELSTVREELNATEQAIQDDTDSTADSATSAENLELSVYGSMDYLGEWLDQGYTLGQSVSIGVDKYICIATHASGQSPITTSGYWTINISLGAYGSLKDPILFVRSNYFFS